MSKTSSETLRAHDLQNLLDKWEDQETPAFEQVHTLIVTIACYTAVQDNPYKAITAVLHCLTNHFYQLLETATEPEAEAEA